MDAMNVATNVRFWIIAAACIGIIFGDIFGENDGILLIIFLMLMMCFSLTKIDFLKNDLKEYRKKIVIGLFLGSILSTVITLAVGLFYSKDIWSGWVILAAVPCAISVVSSTVLMKGDVKLITLSLTMIYLVAIVLTPLISFALIGDSIDPFDIFKYVILFILIPFLVSRPLKKLNIPSNWNTVFINIAFFVFTMIGFGRAKLLFTSNIDLAAWVFIGTIIRIAASQLILEFTFRKMGVGRNDRIPYSLLLYWKNSGLALTLTMLLIPGNSSVLAPAIVSMVAEQIYFMFITWYYDKKVPPEIENPKDVSTAPS